VLIERLRPGLPSAWWMGVGISFSFVAGRINQAPVWLRKIGCGGSIAWRRSPAGSRAAICSTACPSGAALIARSAVRGLRSRRK
jgi:N-acetylglucosaminyldiphosphoundecaprenol N-acetyl-beta-D-mannosaminyltransferase